MMHVLVRVDAVQANSFVDRTMFNAHSALHTITSTMADTSADIMACDVYDLQFT